MVEAFLESCRICVSNRLLWGRYTKIEHVIRPPPGHPSINCRPYRYPPHIQAEIRRQVNEMLQDGLIRKSTSSWSFPVVMTPTSDGSLRFCVDFRKCNRICERDNFPLPHIDDALDSLGTKKPNYFSTLDLSAGYWQIGLKESSKPKSAFITQDGLYEFNVLPMGLSNSAGTFQRVMMEVFRNLNWKFVLRVIACNSGTQMRVRDSSATPIFFKKNRMMQHWAQKITTKF